MITTRDLIQELEAEVAGRSNRHRFNGTAPHDVAFVFHCRSRVSGDDSSEFGLQSFVYQSYPVKPEHLEVIRKSLESVSGPDWQFIGHVFCYWESDGDVHFQVRPTREYGAEAWEKLLNVPIYVADESGTALAGITFREKIMCRFAHRTYEDFLAAGFSRERTLARWDEPRVDDAA